MIKDEDIIELGEPQLSMAERMYLPQIAGGMATTLKHLGRSLLRGQKMTVQYPEEKVPQRVENYRGVHRLNRDENGHVACVACFMCSTACPAHCIHIEAEEAPWDEREKYPAKFDIDELRCIFCGMCEEACPVDAIELTPGYDLIGRSREEMVLDKEELIAVFDETKDRKPRKNPHITGYPHTGNQQEDQQTGGASHA